MAEIFDPNAAGPDFAAQTASVARQRRVAEYLRKQAEQAEAPQAEMVGGQYIAPHWLQQLHKPLLQIGAGMADRQAAGAAQEAVNAQGAHAQQWRSALPQAIAGRAAIPENYVMQAPEDQAGVPGIEAQPLTAERILKHAMAAGGNPALKDDVANYTKYGMMDVENKQKQDAAAELAREKRDAEAQYRRTEATRAAEAAAQRAATDKRFLDQQDAADRRLEKTLAARAGGGGGGGGGGGLGGAAPAIGADEAGNLIYRHTKSGKLFQYNDIGAPVVYEGKVGAKPTAIKDPTEDQSKAAGWYKQANKAFDDMEGATKESAGAAKPDLKEIVAGLVPGFSEEAKTAVRSPARQRFAQGAAAMSEAVLRAATGAGVNRDEALQKIRELTPVYGEDPSLSKQKRASMLMYLDALQTRAGRALPKGPTAPGGPPAAVDNDPLGIRGGK